MATAARVPAAGGRRRPHRGRTRRGLDVRADRMRANLDLTGGQLVAERLAAVLTPELGRAAARALLTRASVRAAESGLPLGTVLRHTPELAGWLDDAELGDLVDPTRYTGAAGHLVDRSLGREPSPAPHLRSNCDL